MSSEVVVGNGLKALSKVLGRDSGKVLGTAIRLVESCAIHQASQKTWRNCVKEDLAARSLKKLRQWVQQIGNIAVDITSMGLWENTTLKER